ncbi:hypothetical protein SeLEV6574_g02496 [Synchytrium endobioticum]|nr:hypothetical protein SeLEV6574_g02496 [Synchytrium endobioticum]
MKVLSTKETEILEIRKALETSVDKGATQTTVELLERLLAVKATEEILRSTGIGIFVNGVKKKAAASNHSHVIDKAKQVVDKWKADVSKAKLQANGHHRSNSSGKSSSSADPKGRNLNVEPPKEANREPSESSNPGTPLSYSGERSAASDGIKLKPLKDKIRDKCLEMLYNALVIDTTTDAETVAKTAVAVEEEVWVKNEGDTRQGLEAYKSKIRTLYSNLKNKSNSGLRENVLNSTVKPERLVSMSVSEMASEERKAEEERYNKEAMHWAVAAADQRATTDQLPCGKCRARKTSYFQKQTRSADEPMTTFCECLACGHHWKFC